MLALQQRLENNRTLSATALKDYGAHFVCSCALMRVCALLHMLFVYTNSCIAVCVALVVSAPVKAA
jgi:hypothetical protein